VATNEASRTAAVAIASDRRAPMVRTATTGFLRCFNMSYFSVSSGWPCAVEDWALSHALVEARDLLDLAL
jgi:hypothetical protein